LVHEGVARALSRLRPGIDAAPGDLAALVATAAWPGEWGLMTRRPSGANWVVRARGAPWRSTGRAACPGHGRGDLGVAWPGGRRQGRGEKGL